MSIDPSQTSCCLITKDATYPRNILYWLGDIPFGEILILTHCDSPHRKQELFAKAKHDYLFYCDDDCLAPARDLFLVAEPNAINCAMKPGHLKSYASSRIALLGWGSIFPKDTPDCLDLYRAKYGEDDVYRRETERIMTALSPYPQNRMDLPIVDLPSAMAPDRLSMQPGHYDFIPVVEQRCKEILEEQTALA